MEDTLKNLTEAVKFLASRLGPHATAEVERMLAKVTEPEAPTIQPVAPVLPQQS